VLDSLAGKGWIVLAAGEALLLRRREHGVILNQRRCAVMIESRDAEDAH